MEFKIQTIEKLFKYILEYSYLLLLPTILLSRAKRLFPVILLSIYGLVFFLLLHYYVEVPKSYRKLYQSTYTFLEYTSFALIIWYYIKQQKAKTMIFAISGLFLVFQIIHYLVTKRQKLDSVAIGVETLLILFFIFIYFRQFFKDNLTRNIYEYPSFWIIVGIFFYLGSGFFFNILVNYIPQQQFDDYWQYTYIPEIIKNILFAVVMIRYPSSFIQGSYNKKTGDIPNLDMI